MCRECPCSEVPSKSNLEDGRQRSCGRLIITIIKIDINDGITHSKGSVIEVYCIEIHEVGSND
jgi:hypothetical protein